MTKDKLLEFYNKLEQEELNVSVIRQLRNCSDKDLDDIMNSFYPEVMMNIVINHEFKLLSIKDQEEIINLVNDAKSEEIAFGIYQIVASGIMLSSGLTSKVAKIICESTLEASQYVVDIALTNSFLINPNSLELLKIISSSTKKYQAKNAADIAKNMDVLLNRNVLEIIKIASKIEGESQSRLINAIAKNREVLSSNLTVKLMILASKVDDNQAEMITTIASNKLLEKNKRSVHYIVRMLEAKHKIPSIYDQAQSEISLLKQRESKIKKDNDIFWNVYKNNPSEAISLLKEDVKDNEEITIHTRVRRKK